MAQIVKELLTKWTYKVDARQIKETGKKIRDLKKNMADVKKSSSLFATSEVRKVNRIKAAWRGLTTQARAYRRETAKASGGGGGGRGRSGGMALGAGGSAFKTFAGARALGLGAGAAAGLAAGPGIAAVTGMGAAIRAAMGAEVARVEFEGFLKSGEKAATLMERLADFGSRTPFQIPQLETLSAQLLAGGFAMEELIPTLRRLGEVTAGGKDSNDRLQRMLTNLVQIRMQGKGTTLDIRQFATARIPIYKALQRTLKVTGIELRKMIETGKVGFKEVNAALKSLTENGGEFEGRMKAISKVLPGRLSNLKDAFFKLGRAIAGPLMEPLSWLVMHFSAFIEDVATGVKWVSQFGTAWKVVGSILTGILFILKPITFKITALFLIIEDLVAFFSGRKSVFGWIVKKMADFSVSFFDWFLQGFNRLKREIKDIVNIIPPEVMSSLKMAGNAGMALASGLTMDRQGMETYGAAMVKNYNNVFNQDLQVGLEKGVSAGEAVEAVSQMTDSAMRSQGRQLKSNYKD